MKATARLLALLLVSVAPHCPRVPTDAAPVTAELERPEDRAWPEPIERRLSLLNADPGLVR